MPARLGKVLYWIACGIAVLFVLTGIVAIIVLSIDGRPGEGLIIFGSCGVIALLVWGFGRACRWVLTDE